MKLTMDFEARSEADLKEVGAWLYSRHPSTEVLCLGWYSEQGGSGQWRMGDPPPEDLFNEIEYYITTVEAHNSFFEMCIWLNVCHERMGWPSIVELNTGLGQIAQWRCSAAKAAACGIPRGLGAAGHAMSLAVVKDEVYGKSAMLKLSRPRKPRKNEQSGHGPLWNDDPETWKTMLEYNMTDVMSEVELSKALPKLTERQLAVWAMTERMNLRGIPMDRRGCEAAIHMAGEYARRLTIEFQKLTGLQTAGQRAKFEAWMSQQGYELPNTQAKTLDDWLKAVDPAEHPEAVRAVEIVRALGRSSIKKYRGALNFADTDDRMRGCFLYHGAHTGRHAGRGGFQPQNLKREQPTVQKKNVMGQAWKDVKTLTLDHIELLYGDPLHLLSTMVRGVVCAPEGRVLFIGDYAQIECRVTFWLADEIAGLDAFRKYDAGTGPDIYCLMAQDIYNRPITKNDELERFLGKQAELALGFGAGFVKYLIHCRALGAPPFTQRQIETAIPSAARRAEIRDWINDKGWEQVKRLIPHPTKADVEELILCKYIVDKYRTKRKKVTELWYACENAVRAALNGPVGVWHRAGGRLAYARGKKFLACRLPSGRLIRYPDARLDGRDIVYKHVDERNNWTETKTYGGKLVENAVQGTAADFMTDGMLRLEKHAAYRELVMTVYDEVVAEVPDDQGDIDEFLYEMEKGELWAAGLPVKAEGFASRRYRK